MRLTSKDSLDIAMSETLPAELERLRISNSVIQYGTTSKGTYLFQDVYCNTQHVCFINLFSKQEHEIVLTKRAPAFFIMMQLQNTFECNFHNMADSMFYEWSINLYHSQNIYATMKLQQAKDYETVIVFISNEMIRRLSKNYPIVKRFYEANNDKEQTVKLFRSNAICDFKVFDFIQDVKLNHHYINAKTYIELINASFELFNRKNVLKQSYVDSRKLQTYYDLRAYIEKHFTEDLHLPALCKMFDLTTYYFEKGFAKIYGVSPMTLLRYYKMSHVRRNKNQIELKELAGNIHYSYNALIKAYQKVYRVHPTIHRKTLKRTPAKRLKRKNRKGNNPK